MELAVLLEIKYGDWPDSQACRSASNEVRAVEMQKAFDYLLEQGYIEWSKTKGGFWLTEKGSDELWAVDKNLS